MDSSDLKIREKELALKKRKQNLSAGKFVVGVVLLGVLSFNLDLFTFFYTRDKDDRDFLSSQRLLLQESDLQQRLQNIAFLDGISARN